MFFFCADRYNSRDSFVALVLKKVDLDAVYIVDKYNINRFTRFGTNGCQLDEDKGEWDEMSPH